MPTRKRRVGFIPRSEVLELINKLSYESNLSNSKLINILVEEALSKRGMLDIITGKVINEKSLKNMNTKIHEMKSHFTKEFTNNFKKNSIKDNLNIKEVQEEILDKEIYSKFLLFLQFQERMKRNEP